LFGIRDQKDLGPEQLAETRMEIYHLPIMTRVAVILPVSLDWYFRLLSFGSPPSGAASCSAGATGSLSGSYVSDIAGCSNILALPVPHCLDCYLLPPNSGTSSFYGFWWCTVYSSQRAVGARLRCIAHLTHYLIKISETF
jgi:hypothetical protein